MRLHALHFCCLAGPCLEADSVAAVDHMPRGKPDPLVANGKRRPGAVALRTDVHGKGRIETRALLQHGPRPSIGRRSRLILVRHRPAHIRPLVLVVEIGEENLHREDRKKEEPKAFAGHLRCLLSRKLRPR